MNCREFFAAKHTQLITFLAAILFCQLSLATEMGGQWTYLMSGSTFFISLNPPLPRRNEPFTIVVSGTGRNSCFSELNNSGLSNEDPFSFTVYEQGIGLYVFQVSFSSERKYSYLFYLQTFHQLIQLN